MKSTFKFNLEEEKSVNYDEVQLLRYEEPTGKLTIVLTNGSHDEFSFSGIVVHSTGLHSIGSYQTNWSKKYFNKLEKGESVTLEN